MSHLGESPGILVQIASREKPDNNLQSRRTQCWGSCRHPKTKKYRENNKIASKDFNDWLVAKCLRFCRTNISSGFLCFMVAIKSSNGHEEWPYLSSNMMMRNRRIVLPLSSPANTIFNSLTTWMSSSRTLSLSLIDFTLSLSFYRHCGALICMIFYLLLLCWLYRHTPHRRWKIVCILYAKYKRGEKKSPRSEMRFFLLSNFKHIFFCSYFFFLKNFFMIETINYYSELFCFRFSLLFSPSPLSLSCDVMIGDERRNDGKTNDDDRQFSIKSDRNGNDDSGEWRRRRKEEKARDRRKRALRAKGRWR